MKSSHDPNVESSSNTNHERMSDDRVMERKKRENHEENNLILIICKKYIDVLGQSKFFFLLFSFFHFQHIIHKLMLLFVCSQKRDIMGIEKTMKKKRNQNPIKLEKKCQKL